MTTTKVKKTSSSLRNLLAAGLLLFMLLLNFFHTHPSINWFVEIPQAEAPIVKTTDALFTQIETANIIQENEIDWSDDMLLPGGHGKPIVVESHKLVFFFIPKVACSVFKRLFRRMMGHSDWLEKIPHEKFNKDGMRHLGHYSRDEISTMLTSPDWTRAIFIRDPLERTLSAYLDKGIQDKEGEFVYRRCCNNNNTEEFCSQFPFNKNNFPFETFVDQVLYGCKTKWDDHWKPQSTLLHDANWKFINFVGNLDNREADTRLMLEKIGAYEEFGASGWGTSRNESIFMSNIARHKSSSKDSISKYYTPTLRRRVFEYVRGDYEMELFNLTIPSDLENL